MIKYGIRLSIGLLNGDIKMAVKELKMRGWVAQDKISDDYWPRTHLFRGKPKHEPEFYESCQWHDPMDSGGCGIMAYTLKELFPNLKWEDGPAPVEITIRPIEEPKMSESENAVWVARDLNGKLYSYKDKPKRNCVKKFWIEGKQKTHVIQFKEKDLYLEKIDDSLFPDIRWEDEPIKVELNSVQE